MTNSGSCSTIRLHLSQGNVRAGLLRSSGSQAIRIEAWISLRLLTNVVLHVEFRIVWVVAFPRLQFSEIIYKITFDDYQMHIVGSDPEGSMLFWCGSKDQFTNFVSLETRWSIVCISYIIYSININIYTYI